VSLSPFDSRESTISIEKEVSENVFLSKLTTFIKICQPLLCCYLYGYFVQINKYFFSGIFEDNRFFAFGGARFASTRKKAALQRFFMYNSLSVQQFH
jgi:hypothetical protein